MNAPFSLSDKQFRLIIVGIALGIIAGVAAVVGSPAGPIGIDSMK